MKKSVCLLGAILVLGLAGVPRAREPESLKLVTALAAECREDGWTLTALTAVRAGEEEEPEVLRGRGKTLTGAWGALREDSGRRAFLGQTGQLLLGESADVYEVLDFVQKDRDLRRDILLYIVRADAGKALEQSAGRTAGEIGGQDPRGVTVGEVLPKLTQGRYAAVPALKAEEEGSLVPGGWAVLGPGGVEGYLEADAALGADLLSGVVRDEPVALGHGGAEVTAVSCRVRGDTVYCTLTGRITEGEGEEAELEQWGDTVLRSALDAGWDCWSLGRRRAALHPQAWAECDKVNIKDMKVMTAGRLVRGHG